MLDHVNVASRDDGRRFVDTTRLDAIDRVLRKAGAPWALQASGPLFRLYGRSGSPGPVTAHPVLISSHADSEYATHHHSLLAGGQELLGTFDNSITNAAVLGLMLDDRLPHDAVVAFTGDEENESRGAVDVLTHLRGTGRDPRAVIVLDVTDDRFYGRPFTVENWFANGSSLPPTEPAFLAHVLGALDGNVPTVHHDDAWQDESWTYEEHDVHVVSLCVPVGPADPENPRPDWMHSEEGVRVDTVLLPAYADALARLAAGCTD